MKNNQLNRVINLVRRTGDRVVVMDAETDEVLVLLRLKEYEEIIDSSEEMADELAIDEDEGEDESDILTASEFGHDFFVDDDADVKIPDRGEIEIKPVSSAPVPSASNPSSAGSWNPAFGLNLSVEPERTKILSEESLEDIPGDGEEEKFYLEPVE